MRASVVVGRFASRAVMLWMYFLPSDSARLLWFPMFAKSRTFAFYDGMVVRFEVVYGSQHNQQLEWQA